jgi:hypothetical protein
MPFINLDQRNAQGYTALMDLLRFYHIKRELPAATRLFIERGADIHARNIHGRTCLHIAVMEAISIHEIEGLLHAIIILIQHGADIFAKDFSGRSIFNDAYECDHSQWLKGSAKGDLWDAALVRCGLGEHIYQPEERKYHFTQRYTESMFETLWKGYEHLCPYPPGTSSPCSIMNMDTKNEEAEKEKQEKDDRDKDNDSDEEESDEQSQNDTSGNESSSEEDDDDQDEEVQLQNRRKRQRRDSWEGA